MSNSTLTCFGGVGTVTGANFLVRHNNTQIVIDCGITQGVEDADERNRAPFGYNPADVDYVFATHAHMDHVGRIPRLVSQGFVGVIYSTPVTKILAELMFEDALGVMHFHKKETGQEALYEKKDVEQALRQWKTIEYGQNVEIESDVAVGVYNAGHILGSAMYEFVLKDTEADTVKRVLCTGDLGNDGSELLDPTDFVDNVDYMLMDSVYGDRNHEDREESRALFKEIVLAAIDRGGALMIPAFSLERTQELLFLLNNLVEGNEIPSIPVYLDSPLAIRITEVYKRVHSYLSEEAQSQIKQGDNIFDFPQLELTRESSESRAINDTPNPKIIIAGSGMSTGGRIMHHEKRYLPDSKSTLLLVGHQAVGTLGRELEEGSREVMIHGDRIPVRARIEKIEGFSAHKDSDHLVEFVAHTAGTLKKVFVAMGEPKSSLALAQRLRDYLGVNALYPKSEEAYLLE